MTQGTEPQIQELMTRGAVAQTLGCSLETVRKLTRRGDIHALKLSRRMIRYQRSSILDYIARAARAQ